MNNLVEFLHAPLRPHWTIGSNVQFGGGVRMGDYIVLEGGSEERGCIEIGDECLIGNFVTIRPPTTMGAKTNLGHNSLIEGYAKIGYHCRIGPSAIFPYNIILEDHVFIAGNFHVANDPGMKWGRPEMGTDLDSVLIRRGARIGVRCTVLPGVTIGENSFVGAGSLITKNVPDRAVVMGHPAKFVREVPNEECI